MTRSFQLGAVFPQTDLEGDPAAAREFALGVEAMGFDHLMAYDHVLGAQPRPGRQLAGPYTEADTFHDPVVLFAHLAALTTKLRFVTGVLVLPQRQTALVARQVADLDRFSGGRFRLGVGVGWNEVEFQALGAPFGRRGALLDEQLEVLRLLWDEQAVSYHGRFHTIDAAGSAPRPSGAIPVWVGGFAPAAEQRAVRFADGFIASGLSSRTVDQLRRLREAAASAGRSTFGNEVVITRPTAAAVVDGIATWIEAGGTHASVSTSSLGLEGVTAHLRFLAEVYDRLERA